MSSGEYAHVHARRRSLFPPDVVDSGEDSDLGHISPLTSNSDCDVSDSDGEYDIIDVLANKENTSTPQNAHLLHNTDTAMSPLCLYRSPKVVDETPYKISPSYKLKTPHDTHSTNTKLPKLVRKSFPDFDDGQNKRKLSPSSTPSGSYKQIKIEAKDSKVRTTLFPEGDMSLPTKTFYSHTEDILETIMKRRATLPTRPPPAKPTRSRKPSKPKPKRRFGEINAGVSHNIRKPKKGRKPSGKSLAAITPAQNVAITEYLNDLKTLKGKSGDDATDKKNAVKEVSQVADETMTPLLQIPRTQEKMIIPAVPEKKPELPKKRPASPLAETDNVNKKFFKFSRPSGVVTMNKSIKVKVGNGNIQILDKTVDKKEDTKTEMSSKQNIEAGQIEFDTNDFSLEEPSMPSANIDEILSTLDDDKEPDSENEAAQQIVLPVHHATVSVDNAVLLHERPGKQLSCPANVILSPISQMCTVTSGLALTSPKKVRNLTPILEEITTSESSKLFPIFNGQKDSTSSSKQARPLNRNVKNKFKKLSASQMLLDAGQKKFGVTECSECGWVYHLGDPSDENVHWKYHEAINIFRFQGWRNERVVATISDHDRIILVLPTDSKIWLKRVDSLMGVVDRELGVYDLKINCDDRQTYLYIKNRVIVGCLVAVPASIGNRVLHTEPYQVDFCSETSYPITCGVSRIWVSSNYRQLGVGRALMDAVRANFVPGVVLDHDDIAISPPTEMGKIFARKYFGREDYLVYSV